MASVGKIVADGGGGDDTIIIGEGVVRDAELHGGLGNDQLVYKGSGRARFFGDEGDDELRGGALDDELHGGEGNDALFGGAGNDRLFGEGGNDRIFGDAGNDYIDGGLGNDTLLGDFADAKITTGFGNDVIHGGEGDDALMGQGGNDWLYGEAGNDRLSGNEGDDFLFGGTGNDNLSGNTGLDRVFGEAGSDAIYWTDGDGIDVFVSGGEGSDSYLATASSADERITLQAVNDPTASLVLTDPDSHSAVPLSASDFGLDLALAITDKANAADTVTLAMTTIESVMINASSGADTIEVFDLTKAGVTNVAIDLGISTGASTQLVSIFAADGITPVLVPYTARVHKLDPVTGAVVYTGQLDANGKKIPVFVDLPVYELDPVTGAPKLVQARDADDHLLFDDAGAAVYKPKVVTGKLPRDADGNPITTPVALTAGGHPVLDANGNPIYRQQFIADPNGDEVGVPLLHQDTVTVEVPSDGNDLAADNVVLHGGQSTVHGDQSLANDTFVVNASGGEVNITRDMGANGVMSFKLSNPLRVGGATGTFDRLEIQGHGGNDILDAGSVANDRNAPDDNRDLVAIEFDGGDGDDRLIGSAFNDFLDSGLGNDTVSGLRGVDIFRDAGGIDTLIEANDADMGLFGDHLVVGHITGLGKGSQAEDAEREPLDALFPVAFVTELTGTGDTWASGAEVETLADPDSGLIFENANLKGGDSNNTIVLNDRDNLIHVTGRPDVAVTDWHGYALLDNAANITSPENTEAGKNEYYILNLKGDTGSRIAVEDSGGTSGFNELYVFGTDERDDVMLDRASGHVTAAMIQVGAAASSGRETVIHRKVNRVNINTLGGDDFVYSDDTAVPVIVHMGLGEDTLTVGTVPQVPDPDNRTIEFPEGVPIADTRNMTNGVSAVMVVYGEDGNDKFEVNHNAAKLFLHGGDGDDTFIINTFITLREQTPEGEAIANLNTLFGGNGNNRYDYVQNAPVFINGGAGTDTITINGTPIADTFVITKNSVAVLGASPTSPGSRSWR